MKKLIPQAFLLLFIITLFSGCANPSLETIVYANKNLTDKQRNELSKSCFLALQRGQDDVAIMVIKQGAYLNWRDEDQGWTLLIAAIYFKESDVAEYLIECGADINLTDYAGRTPLIWAAIRDNEDVAEKLVESGALINAVDLKKQNAIHYAAIYDADYVAEFLLEVQAKRYRVKLKEQNEAAKRRVTLENQISIAEAMKAEKAGKRMQESKKGKTVKQNKPAQKAVPDKNMIQDKVNPPSAEKAPAANIPVRSK